MQTTFTEDQLKDPGIQRANEILRACVHCGFCTATCPTFVLLGDELDSPRGRIYLIKQVMEGQDVTQKTQLHLDRCLTCRACETTCPSGVNYHRLLDIGREQVERQLPRPLHQRLLRRALITPSCGAGGVLTEPLAERVLGRVLAEPVVIPGRDSDAK